MVDGETNELVMMVQRFATINVKWWCFDSQFTKCLEEGLRKTGFVVDDCLVNTNQDACTEWLKTIGH